MNTLRHFWQGPYKYGYNSTFYTCSTNILGSKFMSTSTPKKDFDLITPAFLVWHMNKQHETM